MLFKRLGYRIEALCPMHIRQTFVSVSSGFPPPFFRGQTAHQLPLENCSSMPMSLVLMSPAVPVLCLTPHYKDGVCPSSAYFLASMIGPYGRQEIKVVSLESFNEIKCADGVSESPIVFSWILSWKSVSGTICCHYAFFRFYTPEEIS